MGDVKRKLLVIDNTQPRWFAWIENGESLGFVNGLQEAKRRAIESGVRPNYYLLMSDKIPMRLR